MVLSDQNANHILSNLQLLGPFHTVKKSASLFLLSFLRVEHHFFPLLEYEYGYIKIAGTVPE